MQFPDGSFPWPDGVRAAASFTFDVDAESCVLANDPGATDRMSLMGHQSYGPRVGTPRLLRLLRRRGQPRAGRFVLPPAGPPPRPNLLAAVGSPPPRRPLFLFRGGPPAAHRPRAPPSPAARFPAS